MRFARSAMSPPAEDEDPEPTLEPTLALCIRCGQRFVPARACPHCADLHVRVFQQQDRRDAWDVELWHRPSALTDSDELVVTMQGFPTFTDAKARGHEFLRRFVTERIRARQAR